MNKIRRKIFLFCLLCIFVLTGLTACSGGEEGVKVNSANALARKLASDSAVKINVSKDIVLDEPIVVNGEKEIVGSGKIVAAVEDSEEVYMITVANGGKLTVGGSVEIDAAGLAGAIHVQDGGSAIVQDKAVVMNASEVTANALVEGSLEIKGGTLKDAKGHNIYNKKETVISGGEIVGSGNKYAGIYNEGTLSQIGGSVTKAYNNISNMSGSTFTFEGGTNTKSIRDGVFVAEGATLKATKKDATIEEAGARGILLHGTADIKLITVQSCGDTLIKVGKNGVLNLGNGILQEGNYHGVDNAGTMTMMGGNIQMNKNCGIVNTGTLKVTGGNISSNENKGILNKHEGTADVTSAMVTFTSNKIAIGNEDKAVFEFAKAKIMMSTMTNIYCYDGTINLHDASLNASTSNNVRVIEGTINMKNVEVKGNSQKSNASHHGIIMDGGEINAENVTVSMTTGCGMRVKGGVFKGKNIKMHDINRTAISMSKHDYLDVEGLVDIKGLEVESTNYNNVLNEGGGTIKITDGKLAVAGSNSVRADGGRTELTNVMVPGHKEGSKNYIHGIYLEGGEIIAKNVTVQNTSGNALRNKNGKFVGTNITMNNIKGDTAIANCPLDDENKDGIIEIDGLTIKNAFSKNITLDCGVTTIKNATLGATGGNNIKMQNNAATLNLYNVKVEGQREDATASTHGIMVEGGNVYGENVQIYNTMGCGIRCKLGVVDLKNVTMTNISQTAISNSKMVKDDVELGVGNLTIDGLTTSKIGINNVTVDAGTVTIKNGELCKIETKNHNVKTTGTGVLNLDTVKIAGTTDAGRYGIIAEGGEAVLNNVEIYDLAKSGIHANKETSKVTATNVVIKDAVFGITGSNGSITIDGLTTEDISANNILAENKLKVTIKNSTGEMGLSATPGHNAKATGDALVTLENVEVKGVTAGDKYAIMAEGGDFVLKDVVIRDVKNSAIRINKKSSSVKGENVTIANATNAISSSNGKVVIDNLVTSEITNNNVLVNDDGRVTIKNSEVSAPNGHNMKAEADGLIILDNVKLLGVTSGGKHVLMAEGGDFELNKVEITGAKNAAIRINRATSTVTGKDVTITDSVNGISGSDGEVEIEGLTTTGVTSNNILAESNGIITVTDAELGKAGGHNVKATGSAVVTLTDAEIKGTSSNSHHILMAEGGDFVLNNVVISGTTTANERAAIRINKASSEVTGKNVTITDCMFGISGDNGSVSITGLTSSAIKRNLYINGGTHVIKDATLNTTAQNNIHMGAGTLTLNNVSVEGVTGEKVDDTDYRVGIYVGGATLNVENQVTVKNTSWQGVHNDGGTITGDKLVTQDTGNIALWNTAAGSVELDELVISGVKNGHGIKNEGENSTITVEKGDIGKSPSNNVYVSNGTVTLKDTTIRGTVANHGVLAQGGDVVLENVVIENAAGAGIRVNRSSSEVKGTNVTITGCGEGISNTDGVVDMENVDTTGCTKGIWTNATLKLAGEVKSKIQLGVANEVTATKALTGSVFTLDWDEGKIPADFVAIQFASVEDMQATKENSTISFGTNASVSYLPYFYGTQLLLNDKNNMQYTVKNFAELQEVMETINTTEDINTATITVAGDITVTELVTVKAGKNVRIQDDTTVRTIKRGASYTKGDLFVVEAGASLEFGASSNDNSNPTLKIDGGSKNETPVITEPDSSFVRNNGTLTVASGVQMANAKGSEDYCKALAIHAGENSMTTFKGVMKSIVGQYSTNDGYGYGIAITVGKTQDFVIEDAIIKDNYTPEIGIIRLESGGKLTIKNSTFENNEAVKEAGVISESGNANNRLSIEGSTFKNNKTSGNGGVMAINCATKDNITITNTTFTKNTANAGAAINMLTGASITLSDCTFTENVTTNTSTTDSNCGYGDIRLGGNHETGGIYISGKMIVDIYMNQAGKVNVVGALTEGSDVVANWRKGKITGDSFVGINYASEEVMSASKEYISLSDNYSSTYVIKNVGTTGTLVKPTVVTNETELQEAITTISEASDKTGFIKVTENFTLSNTVNIPEGVNVTILDDGTAKTITRAAEGRNKSLFEVKSGAIFSLVSTSKNNAEPTLTIDGGSASITNSNGAALIGVNGTVNVGQGVVLTNNKSTGNNQGFAIYSNAGSTTVFSGVVSNIVGTHSSVKGNVFVIKGAFTLENAIVKDNVAVAGGAIRLQGGQLTAINTVFENNKSEGNGGIIFADSNASENKLTLEGCTFTGNTATGNGGAIYNFSPNTKIVNCKFDSNTAGTNGGAIYSGSSVTLTITGDGTDQSLFVNNKATGAKTKASDDPTYYGGGAICIGSGNLTVSGYKFTGNETKADGGAINNRGNSLIVNNCEFSANKAVKHTVDGYGGAIFMFQGTLTIDVDQTTVTKFDGNEATYGGAIYQRAGTITSHNAVFNENKGGWNGGALYHKKEVTLKDCHFTANTTASKGGAVCNEGGTLNANNCEFTGNISNDEGGAYRQAAQGVGTFTSCTFTNNIAKKTGGGAIKYHNKSLIIDGCIFSGNTATEGDANGHDIKLSTTTTKPTIKNSTFDASNVRDSAGKAGAYTDGGNNTLVTEE